MHSLNEWTYGLFIMFAKDNRTLRHTQRSVPSTEQHDQQEVDRVQSIADSKRGVLVEMCR